MVEKKYDVVLVQVEKIKPDPKQPRKTFDEKKMKENAESYKHHGVLSPIEIDENNVIVFGELRWRTAKAAGLKEIPCIVRKGLSQEERWERQLVENFDRQDMKPAEYIPVIRSLLNSKVNGFTLGEEQKASNRDKGIKSVAAKLGLSREWVNELVAIDERGSTKVRKAFDDGKIGTKTAARISTMKDKGLQDAMVKEAVEDEWKKDEVVNAVARLNNASEYLVEKIKSGEMSVADGVVQAQAEVIPAYPLEVDDLRSYRKLSGDLHGSFVKTEGLLYSFKKHYDELTKDEARTEKTLALKAKEMIAEHIKELDKIIG